MTPATLLQVSRACGGPGLSDAPAEWLVTNGLGGYAFGTVAGPPARRFHGLLVAALPAPAGRTMLLHAIDECVSVEGHAPVCLSRLSADQPLIWPSFALVAGLPVWTFPVAPNVQLERALMLPHGQNTVHVRYRLLGAPAKARIEIRPWLDVRPHQASLVARQQLEYATTALADGRVDIALDGMTVLRVATEGGRSGYTHDPEDRHDVPYAVERDRGYDWVGSAHSPGVMRLELDSDPIGHFTATRESWTHVATLPPAAAWELELKRRERLVGASDPALQTLETFLLPLAADQFLIRPVAHVNDTVRAHAAGAQPRSVIAGYPWFTDWGRDTMISLEGLALTTGRASEARDVLRTFSLHVRHGLIPNLFPEGERDGVYHTADATLWFFHALDRYDQLSGDPSLVDELLPVVEEIVRCHQAGTSFNIHVDTDGLLTQGTSGLPLTWMDARMGDWVVTPRRGKAVEINALWHNALWLLHGWLVRAGRGLLADDLARAARQCHDAFNLRFWNEERQCLFDVVDGEQGDDPSCRPNQLLAISVRYPPLDPARWPSVLRVVADELMTPLALRTLAPSDPGYQHRYAGDLRARDGAYHQGTAWPWLFGPFVDAWCRVYPDDLDGARALLVPLLEHVLATGGMGSVSEIFDPEPPYTARGCPAQAWSVAELTRLVAKIHAAQVAAADAAPPQ
jgi:predicted glycogen debranching enzyme